MHSSRASRRSAGLPAVLLAVGAAGALASAAPAEAAPALSWIVRLSGPTLWEIHAAGTPATGPSGHATDAAPELEARRRGIAAAQDGVARAVVDLGGTVVDRYQVAYNGLVVHASRDAAAAVAELPGVAAVTRAPRLAPAVGDVVRTIGADKAAAQLGFDGRGVTVAVIDTGIDYTHAALGGPGTVEAYELNEENRVEAGSFPTAKVVGGYDFAGWRYSPACPDAGGNACHRTPQPDDDPLDPVDLGHGTHVAGIVAGVETPHLAAGVAPGASLVALKIFGNPVGAPVTTDLAISAIEWVVRHNLGLPVPGNAPEGRIDVINMSLGADWSSHMVEINRAVDTAVASGVTVVASAGNAGALPYVVNSPSSADLALSVASSVPSGELELRVTAGWSEQGRVSTKDFDAIEGARDWLPTLVSTGPVRSTLAWYGTACNTGANQPSRPIQDVARRVALVERGDCDFYEKVTNAERYGAVAVVVFTDGSQKTIMTCGTASPCHLRPGIPAVMIDRQPGIELRDLLMDGVTVNMTLGTFEKTYLTDTISDFSSRGPARFDAGIKPQVTAPGTNVRSALVGSGDDALNLSGTSMAGPAVAGTAAILWQRNHAQKLALGGADIGALVMNYADPVVHIVRQDTGPLAAVMRQGSGRVNALRSAAGTTLVRSDHGLAALGFGHVHVRDEPVVVTRTLRVRNLANRAQSYGATADLAFPDEDDRQGVRLTFAPERLTVPAGSEGRIEVKLTVEPKALRAWDLRGAEAMRNEAALQRLEVDGWVGVAVVDGNGRPIVGGDRVGVPFHVLPRRHTCVAATAGDPLVFLEPEERQTLAWRNGCGIDGTVSPFYLGGTDNAESSVVDGFPERVDIDAVGVRFGRRADKGDGNEPLIAWAIHTRAPQRIPAEVEYRVYVDLERDGTFDQVVFNHPANELDRQLAPGQWVVTHAPVSPGTLEPDLQRVAPRRWPQAYDLDASTAILRLPAREIGVDLDKGKAVFDFAVMAVDAVDDFPLQPGYQGRDYAPDGMRRGQAFTFDQPAMACLELADPRGRVVGIDQSLDVPAGDTLRVQVKAACALGGLAGLAGVLFHYPDNLPDRQAELRQVRVGTWFETPTAGPTRPSDVPPSATAKATAPATAVATTPASTATPSPVETATATPSASSTATPAASITSVPATAVATDSPTPTAPAPATDTPATAPIASTGTPSAEPGTPGTPTVPPVPATVTATPTVAASATQTPVPPSATATPTAPSTATPSATRVPPSATATTAAPPTAALPNLSVRDVEINQAVQQAFSSIPLVAGRATLVRVNVALGWGNRPVPGVTGRLHGVRDGLPLPGAPLAPFHAGGAVTVPPAPDPLRLDDTLNFLLPEAWVAEGEVTLWVELNPERAIQEYDYSDNRSPDLIVTFRPVPPLHVVVVPVEVQPGGIGAVARPDLDRADLLGMGWLQRLYPVPGVDIGLHAPLRFEGTLASASGQRGLLQALSELRLREHPDQLWVAGAPGADGLGADAARGVPIYYGVLPAEAGGGTLAFRGGGVAAGPADRPTAAARAIGLALGLHRVACSGTDVAGVDPAYPYAGGIIGHVGLDVLGLAPMPPTRFDFMSDCDPTWVSDYHYGRLYDRLSQAGTRGDADAPQAASATRGPAWLVSGTVAGGGKSGTLDALEALADAAPASVAGAPAGTGRYRVELRDDADRTRFSHAFEPMAMVAGRGDLGAAGFGMAVPQLSGAAEVVLTADGRVLARMAVDRAATPPLKLQAAVLPPTARDPHRLTVVWETTGGRGAPAAGVRYSADGGQTWRQIVAESRAAQIPVDRRALPGSANGLLEVVATAGTQSAVRRLALGRLPNLPPRVDVAGHALVQLRPGQSVVLAATGVDPEDGLLADGRLTWRIGSVGLTASGGRLTLAEGLPAGIHVVTATATDGAGATGTATVTLLVGDVRRVFLPWATTWR
ncbi:hypothetical protein DCC79_03480 [bacterium]|nr:MAG: hypothetical protein DCC79_03480 [bacterium]